ncbi:MAG: ribulose-phosphate 3-epimerase [Myxococcota bacterium]|nr:ribulose-phosphate 3-epimerase [Myxococcota bacterium]
MTPTDTPPGGRLPTRIAPSILASDFSRLGEEVRAVEEAGADWIHVDVMDGHFVPNLTLGPPIVEAVKRSTTLPLDVHLMIESPELSIADYANAGADTIGVHVETCPHLHRTLAQIREAGARACAVVNPSTPAQALEPVLGDLDQLLVMTVNPGFGGQKFIPEMMEKVRRLRSWLDERQLAVDLEIDGGVGPETIAVAAEAGANVFVAGTAIFGEKDYADAIENLRKRAEPFGG